jgi:anti-sigma B factor antagonist
MNISQRLLDSNITLIQLDGRLDARSSPHVRATLQELLENDRLKIIIDLDKVPFIDSSGSAALVSGLRMARTKGGNIALSGAQSQAQIVFRLTMLDRVFPVHPTYQEAAQSLAQ